MADNYNNTSSTKNALNTPATDRSTTGDVVGETTGGLAGAATGAALGSLGGPLGTIIGGIAGAASGWWTGRQVSEAASSFDNDDSYYQNHYNSSRSGTGTGMTGSAGSSASSASSSSYDTARPAYQLGHVAGMNPEYANRSYNEVEPELRRGYESYASNNANAPRYDEVRGHIADAYGRGQERRLTLSEEQLNVGKRQVEAGEASVRKTVETQHVQETVPLMRDEVSIERRPLSGADASNLSIGEQTIRVPLTREEAVVEKRVVGTEEVVINTRQVTDNQTVEADLRKERLVTDGAQDQEGYAAGTTGSAGTMGTTGTTRSGESLTDRVKDTARDLKNDVTGR